MKIIHLSKADGGGGAARAAYRIHRCLVDYGISSVLFVDEKYTTDRTVIGPKTRYELLRSRARRIFDRVIKRFILKRGVTQSIALLPSHWPKMINDSDADIVHLHWINGEMLSISDISKINKPIVWTLHDMWPFCGAFHIVYDDNYVRGYEDNGTISLEPYKNIDRMTWKRKRRHYTRPINMIAPSRAIQQMATRSSLMRGWNVDVIPHPIDLSKWAIMDKREAKKAMGLDPDKKIILFIGLSCVRDNNKGFDLLMQALSVATKKLNVGVGLAVIGDELDSDLVKPQIDIYSIGLLRDEISLVVAYNAADCVVVPSRYESFGQVALEAQSCGVPVVAFDNSGPADIVAHNETGYLARAFDVDDFSNGIISVIEQENGMDPQNIRGVVADRFSYDAVAKDYMSQYKKILGL